MQGYINFGLLMLQVRNLCRGYNDFSQKFATRWTKRLRPH